MHRVELNWIRALRGDGSLATPMIWISDVGLQALPCIVAAIFFLQSRKVGLRFFFLLSLSAAFLSVLKLAFHWPRPYWLDAGIVALSPESSYGMPSGHAVQTTLVWLAVAEFARRWWVWTLAIGTILLVSFSRIYLGCHFISDVVGGIIIAIAILWIAPRLEAKLSLRSIRTSLLLAACAVFVLLVTGWVIRWNNPPIGDPASWPGSASGDLGALFSWGGASLAAAWVAFADRDASPFATTNWKRAFALGFALAGAWVIREVDHAVPKFNFEPIHLAVSFSFGCAAAAWVFYLAPRIMIFIGLLPSDSHHHFQSTEPRPLHD